MADIIERKQKLFEVVDGYAALLERWGDKNRNADLISMRKAVERGRYHIALVGSVSRGKSTLLNALLGDEKNPIIAPVSINTCTAAIVKYFDSALYPETPGKEGAIIHFNDGRNPAYIEKEDVSRYVDLTKGFAKSEAERVDCIEIYGNFPLVEKRGVIVDTPGRESVYDQDYLTTGILPEVDVIISPIAADLPLDRTETDFLTSLPEQEKQKLMFVLTKTDAVDGPGELPETIADVQKRITAIAGGSPRLFKTAAKKVVDDRKQGKTAAEVESTKSRCGVKELETALDEKLRTGSSLDEQIRRICNTLGDDLAGDKKRLTENKESLSLEAADLEQKKKGLGSLMHNTKVNFDKGAGKLKREWEREVKKFTAKLETKGDAISDRLTAAVEKENLLSLIGYSSKLERKIRAILQQELSGELADMNDKLTSRVEAFAEQLRQENDTEFEVYGRAGAGSSVKSEINTLIGGGIAVGGGVWGVTTALGAISTIRVAAEGITTATAATSAATSIAAKAGIFPKIGRILFTGAAPEVKNAITAGAFAQSGLVSALIGGVIPIVGGIVVTKLAYQFGTSFAKDKAVKNIPLMVEKQLNESIRSIESSSQKVLDAVLSRFKSNIDDMFDERQNELDSIIESLKNLNKDAKLQEIDRDLQEIGKLSTALNRVD